MITVLFNFQYFFTYTILQNNDFWLSGNSFIVEYEFVNVFLLSYIERLKSIMFFHKVDFF